MSNKLKWVKVVEKQLYMSRFEKEGNEKIATSGIPLQIKSSEFSERLKKFILIGGKEV